MVRAEPVAYVSITNCHVDSRKGFRDFAHKNKPRHNSRDKKCSHKGLCTINSFGYTLKSLEFSYLYETINASLVTHSDVVLRKCVVKEMFSRKLPGLTSVNLEPQPLRSFLVLFFFFL